MDNPTSLKEFPCLWAPPIAIGFSDQPPGGLERWQGGAVPAGCVFWREAMKGGAFYTAPPHHHNCAVGAYTHSLSLPTQRGPPPEDTVIFMVLQEDLWMEE